MPDVHLPHLHEDEHSERPAAKRSLAHHPAVKLVLEVVLISAGVFLGIAGEQWRENARHRELAQAALRSFRSEMVANRRLVATVRTYHEGLQPHLNTFFSSGQAVTAGALSQTFEANQWEWKSVYPVWLQHSAWDLALATQALEYLDPGVAFTLSRAYTAQSAYEQFQSRISPALYSTLTDMNSNFRAFLNLVQAYLGDADYFEPGLLKAYDEALPQIDLALGEG